MTNNPNDATKWIQVNNEGRQKSIARAMNEVTGERRMSYVKIMSLG